MIAIFATFSQNTNNSKSLAIERTANTINNIREKAIAPDFTVTFTDGRVANLYDTLNAGNTVLLDFFFTT